MPLEKSTQLSAERRVPHPGTGQDSGEEQKEDQRQQDGQQQHCPWLWWNFTDGIRVGGTRSCLHQALDLTSGMGLTAGCGGGSVLEVSWLTGDTVDVSIHNFIWQKKGRLVFSVR